MIGFSLIWECLTVGIICQRSCIMRPPLYVATNVVLIFLYFSRFQRWQPSQPWLLQNACHESVFRIRVSSGMQAIRRRRLSSQETQLYEECCLQWDESRRSYWCHAGQGRRPYEQCSDQAQDDHDEEWSFLLRGLILVHLWRVGNASLCLLQSWEVSVKIV